jgi:AcrR family transcriptional regulator
MASTGAPAEPGLRDRKKLRTRVAIADAALPLFLERGFDAVTVVDVARAADVSVQTVFNYFPTKEDLFFDRQAQVEVHAAEVVRHRRPGESAAQALKRDFVDALLTPGSWLGLSDDAARFWRVVEASPALQARLREMADAAQRELEQALAEAAEAIRPVALHILIAAQLSSVLHALHADVRRRVVHGESAESVRDAVLQMTELAFSLVERGIGDFPNWRRGRRRLSPLAGVAARPLPARPARASR